MRKCENRFFVFFFFTGSVVVCPVQYEAPFVPLWEFFRVGNSTLHQPLNLEDRGDSPSTLLFFIMEKLSAIITWRSRLGNIVVDSPNVSQASSWISPGYVLLPYNKIMLTKKITGFELRISCWFLRSLDSFNKSFCLYSLLHSRKNRILPWTPSARYH